MKKKCMAIARKVMVWSLAASMLVATPLTVSATGLNEVYKVEDNAGNEVPSDSNSTRTGTVTSTNSRTSVLDNVGEIEGIVLSETDVNLTLHDNKKNSEKTLKVTILGSGITDEEMAKLQRSITWKSSDTGVVALGNLAKDNGGNTQSMLVKAKAGGAATVTVSLDNYAENIHFTATANVSVKEYATKLEFSKDYIPEKDGARYGYVKHSVNLNAALVKEPGTANDEITFEIVSESVKGAAAIDKKGFLTYKKAGKITIVAVGERVKSQPLEITIDAGNPANKVEIWLDKAGETKKAPAQKPDVSIVDNREIKVVAKLEIGKGNSKKWAGEDGSNRNDCTDAVVWSSNKPAIVKVDPNGDKATLIPTGVGSAVITAQASTGKKATLSVKVSATMTDIKITSVNQAIYSGQTLKLTADRYFGTGEDYKNFPGSDGVTWYLVKNATDKKYAQIKKDVFTAKAAVTDANAPIEVKVRSAKKYGKPAAVVETSSEALKITLKQADVQKIEVKDGTTTRAKVGFTPASANKVGADGTVVINAGNGKTFMVTAYGPNDETTLSDGTPLATTLNISSNKEKSAIASRNEQGNAVVTAPADAAKGVATITVSGTKCTKAATATASAKYGAIKAAFKADVKIPAKTIQLTFKKKVVQATLKNANTNITKKQNVTVTATLPKGTTTAPKSIKWKATVVAPDGTQTPISVADGKNGVVKLTEGGYAAGDVIVVNAYIRDTADTKVGATSTIRIPVVTPSRKVAIWNAKTNAIFTNGTKKNQTEMTTSDELELKPMIDIAAKGTDNFVPVTTSGVADVTYSVNKKGIVYIVDGKVKAIKAGKVNIIATTSDGKKATLAVTVR